MKGYLKRVLKRFDDAMMAVAFAEAGQPEMAKEVLLQETSLSKRIEFLKHEVDLTVDDLTSMAIAFAQAGQKEKAVKILEEAENRLEEIRQNFKKELPAPAVS